MYCNQCGAELAADSQFCQKCGRAVASRAISHISSGENRSPTQNSTVRAERKPAMTKMSYVKPLFLGLLALAGLIWMADRNRTRNLNETPATQPQQGTAEQKVANSPPASQEPTDTCFDDTRTSDTAYKRMMRANDYSHIVHEQLGWSGGVWTARGPNCTSLTITMGQQEPESFKTYFHENLGFDLCSYGFTAISFDGDCPES